MGPIQWFIFVYVLGGLTFIPLVLLLLFLFAYYTLPDLTKLPPKPSVEDPASLVRNGDLKHEKLIFKTGTDDLAEKFHRKHDSDVASGYFAVCREYVPGGVNGKPPEKLSPAGEMVAQESPSVYQSMYRSIFDRSPKPTIEPHKDGTGKQLRRASNVFFVVLRHGHLMLYDDIQQLEVRYVISLEHHDVDIYGGEDEDEIPEAELWIKRNAIRLSRKPTKIGDRATSLPFFFFSENLSEKEDFYHAILSNQEKHLENPPIPQEFETANIIKLVQRLHSSEEQLQTRWLNAILGRLFLAMYQTPYLEQQIRKKLTKKISRVKKPNFITKLALQKIDTGKEAPCITNPRLKDLTVNGECVVEADVDYTGLSRIEIAATARIDLGTRFKAREVDMVLAATCKKLSGHILIRFKPPPSNRMWFTFEKMPKIEMTLEPIVSSRQITYTVILKAIQSRIMEVIAEAVVLPFWDDIPFLDTAGEKYRGGIWEREPVTTTTTEIKVDSPEDEVRTDIEGLRSTTKPLQREDLNLSTPILSEANSSAALTAARKSVVSLGSTKDPIEPKSPNRSAERISQPETPRALRSSSFASAVHPAISPAHADGDTPAWDIKHAQKRDNMLKDMALRSSGTSPETLVASSLPKDAPTISALKDSDSHDSSSTASSLEEKTLRNNRQGSGDSRSSQHSRSQSASFPGPNRASTVISQASQASTNSDDSVQNGETQRTTARNWADAAKSLTSTDRKQALSSAMSAAQAAQKWGWGVLARNRQRESEANNHAKQDASTTGSPTLPMGRGRPLPPPGQPLPPPDKPSLFTLPKRKPVPPPIPADPASKRASAGELSAVNGETRTSSPGSPALPPENPNRRRRQASLASYVEHGQDDEVLIVEAPAESNPPSPLLEYHDGFFGHGETQGGDDQHGPEVREKAESPRESQGLGIANVTASEEKKINLESGSEKSSSKAEED